MPKCKNSLKHEVCQGCLVSGRRIIPIKEYLRLYQKLIQDDSSEQTMHRKVPLMCWECRSVLRKVQKFQKKAKQAYWMLMSGNLDSDNKKATKPDLSTLTPHSPNNPEYEIAEDYIKLNNGNKIEQNDIINIDQDFNENVKIEIDDGDVFKEEENYDNDIKEENNSVDIDIAIKNTEYNIDNINNIEASIKDESNINESELRKDIKLEEGKLKKNTKFKIVRKMDYESFNKLCIEVKIDEEERQRYMQVARKSEEYLNATFKCKKCVVGYRSTQKYEQHMKGSHSESNAYVCELCGARLSTKMTLRRHVWAHGRKHVCALCGYERRGRRAVYSHIARAHCIAYECRECGLRFQHRYKEFYKHYNSMHKRFVCDYCGFGVSSKKRLANHIRVNHCENVCKYCNKRYAVYHSMTRHIALRHTKEVSEESYCVECNMQFDNIFLYTRHLKTSVKHKPKIVFPCTECPNVYAKKTAMNNHYKYIHLQKTNYYCDKCSRYFLNGFRLRTHIATYHNNIQAPKNKICSYCGRGFVTNRILDNHIRTHTGERPFSCSHCTATFAQKSALVTHARAIHKVMMRYTTKD